jgi:hypothetical protein
MAWVRRVGTASGVTAVQIAESVGSRRRIVQHVGSSREEIEFGLLLEEAQRLLADDRQGMLDLGIAPARSKAVMVPPPAAAGLFASAAVGRHRGRWCRDRVCSRHPAGCCTTLSLGCTQPRLRLRG